MSQTSQPDPSGKTKLLRVALAVSVGINLLVAGLGVGAVLNGGPGRDQMARDLGFGPFSEALDMPQRRLLRDHLMQKSPEIRGAMQQRRADMERLLVTLRAEPFDPVAMRGALEATRARLEAQLALGQTSLGDVLVGLPEAERLAFADRLERGQRRGGKDHGDKP